MTLTLPDIRQKPHDWTCGRVCAEVVWELFGVRKRIVPATPLDGTAPDTLETVLWESGLPVIAGTMDLVDLRYHTKRGRPVICLVTEEDGTGHYVVVGGFKRRKHEGVMTPHVSFQDPLCGPVDEPAEDFEARWVDNTRRGVMYVRWGMAVGV